VRIALEYWECDTKFYSLYWETHGTRWGFNFGPIGADGQHRHFTEFSTAVMREKVSKKRDDRTRHGYELLRADVIDVATFLPSIIAARCRDAPVVHGATVRNTNLPPTDAQVDKVIKDLEKMMRG
jgi:predicted DNA-binding WGR domain protein